MWTVEVVFRQVDQIVIITNTVLANFSAHIMNEWLHYKRKPHLRETHVLYVVYKSVFKQFIYFNFEVSAPKCSFPTNV